VPVATDHTLRRLEVARAAVHSIARTGLEGATLRAVADEGGWSVGVVQYYFRNKSELLSAAVDFLAERTADKIDQQSGAPTVLSGLTEVLKQIVHEDGQRAVNSWRVWICFWAQGTNDPLLAKAVEGHARRWRERLAAIIRAGQVDGSIRRDLDPENEAAYLAAAIDGLGITSVVDREYPFHPGMVDRLVARLSSDSSELALLPEPQMSDLTAAGFHD